MKKLTKKEAMEMLNPPKEKNVHYVWHNFMKYMKRWYGSLYTGWIWRKGRLKKGKRKYRQFESSQMVGYQAMCRVARYAKDKDDIFVTRCDDSWHMGSDIVLISHECEDDFMGTTMILVPQNKRDINQVFLYPEHVKGLIKVLQELDKRAKEKDEDYDEFLKGEE